MANGRDLWRSRRQAVLAQRLAAFGMMGPTVHGEQPKDAPSQLPSNGGPLWGFAIQQLMSINAAIASGITRVSYDGKTTEYRSLDELIRIRDMLLGALGMTLPGPTVLAVHDRGFGGGGDPWGAEDLDDAP